MPERDQIEFCEYSLQIYYNIKTEQLVVQRKPIIGGDTYFTVLTGLAGYARYEVRMSAYTKTGEGKKTDPVEFVTPDGSKFFVMLNIACFVSSSIT